MTTLHESPLISPSFAAHARLFPCVPRPEARSSPPTWTPARDADLQSARAQGLTWAEVARRLGVSKWSAVERGRKIGVRRPPMPHRSPPESLSRPPLTAGHSRSWGALTAGTLLDGVAYPYPVFE